jgi:Protein of unknown function (DUF790)
MLKLADLRKTTRRAKSGDLRIVYPTLLRDRSLAPRIGMAVRYLESMLGRPRHELDAEVIVQLFGDHKLARCIVACLAATYRHRPRAFAEILPAEVVAALAERGIATPSDLRLHLYRRANGALAGFVGGPERAPFLRAVGGDLGLAPEQIETLLTLDAPANAILVRTGPIPTPDDVIARYNYETAAALLANASIVRVSLSRAPTDAATLRALCAQAGVTAELAGHELVLHGRQDALNGWARHGARLVRLLSALLCCGLPARSAEALVAAPTGDWLFRLDAATLADLGARPLSPASSAPAFDPADLLAAWQTADALTADFAALRRSGEHHGWSLRRAVEPVVLHGAILPALFTCSRTPPNRGKNGNAALSPAAAGSLLPARRGGIPHWGLVGGEVSRVPLIPAPTTAAGAALLADVAARQPLVALALPTGDAVPPHLPADIPTLRYTERGDAAVLPALLARAVGEVDARAEVARLEALFEEVRATGVLTEPKLAERLRCDEDEVALRLAMPAARAAHQADDVHYIEGFGLCTADTLAKAQAATAEVASLRADQPVGSAWVLRQLGRRLRAVTGASEGIECLIAYLGAA